MKLSEMNGFVLWILGLPVAYGVGVLIYIIFTMLSIVYCFPGWERMCDAPNLIEMNKWGLFGLLMYLALSAMVVFGPWLVVAMP